METTNLITGFGGLFFRAKDPNGMSKWYEDHFGINSMNSTTVWKQEAGPTVFAPFQENTAYFGKPDQVFMLNFRVKDLDTLLAKLQAAGVQIDEKRQDESIGRFAWVYDPEGNKIELWEPTPESQWKN